MNSQRQSSPVTHRVSRTAVEELVRSVQIETLGAVLGDHPFDYVDGRWSCECQRRDRETYSRWCRERAWPKPRPHWVRYVPGQEPSCARVDAGRWRCVRCGREGTRWQLERAVLDSPECVNRLLVLMYDEGAERAA